MEDTKKTIEEVVKELSVLTADEQQLLKDTIIYGSWGDGSETFLNEPNVLGSENTDYYMMMGYCTNDAKNGGHFNGRQISAMFRNIYRKMCPENHYTIGYMMSHCNDWWGDGSGDMLFIRDEFTDAIEEWARK